MHKSVLLLVFASTTLAGEPPKNTDHVTEPAKPKMVEIAEIPGSTSLWLYSDSVKRRDNGWVFAQFRLQVNETGTGKESVVVFDCIGKRSQTLRDRIVRIDGYVGPITDTEFSPERWVSAKPGSAESSMLDRICHLGDWAKSQSSSQSQSSSPGEQDAPPK
jgi:hypothetical protein